MDTQKGEMKIVIGYFSHRNFHFIAKTFVEDLLNSPYLYKNIPDLNFHLHAPQMLGENREGGDYRMEFNLEVSANNLPDDFIQLFCFFTEFAKKREEQIKAKHNEQLCITYVIKNNGFFNLQFEPAHTDLRTREVHFGHIIPKSIFYSHRKHVQDPSAIDILHRRLDPNIARNSPQDTIFTNMEHDRRILLVKFPYRFRPDPKGKYDAAIVNLVTKYSNFRRVIIDMAEYRSPNGSDKNRYKYYEMKIYFHLTYPMSVKLYKFFKDKMYTPNDKDRLNLGDRYPNWENGYPTSRQSLEINESTSFMVYLKAMHATKCAKIIARLFVVTGQKIEFRHLTIIDFPIINRVADPTFDKHWQKILTTDDDLNENGTQPGPKFGLMYFICALLSRGSAVKDQMLISKEERDRFLNKVMEEYNIDRLVAMEALDRLLSHVDESLEVGNLTVALQYIMEKLLADPVLLQQIFDENKKEGFVRVRKIIITPTRILYVSPELLMSNRVLRRYDVGEEKALRVLFRDDDGSKIHLNNVSQRVIDRTVGDRLKNGVEVAGLQFAFLGSSNSQMRDNGCYFFNGSVEEITKMRKDLGKFKMTSVPKLMSRIGQCFTQAREVQVELFRSDYNNTYDFIGGEDRNKKPYTFSDGVGVISYNFARKIAKSLEMNDCVPSCFQIRFRGYKGVMSVDLSIDELHKWGKDNYIEDPNPEEKKVLYLAAKFRPSQEKFHGPRQTLIEIVKHSAPVPVSLNKPLINIIDQVSAMQSHGSHKRICNRIHWLLDRSLHELTRSLIDEQKLRNKLNEFPKLILYEQLNDFQLTQEPFFRSMVVAAARCSLNKLLHKLQIPISTSLGRSMFGIVDETGELQYGQVYVRYTKNASLSFPGKNAERVTHIGPIFLTKNPCIVPGDIRMFEAVDIPGLSHLSDVVVFPRWGPRPHTDEMAGSDLDGDEYTVIWDEQLYLDRNEPAFDFTSDQVDPEKITEESLPVKMCDFYVDYMSQDSIGKIANAFINNSDQYGINSEVCSEIAKKHNKAVDFPKTGIAPPLLTTKWGENGDLPPEKCERWADFMDKPHEPAYASPRLIGQLFRRVKVIDDILKLVTKESEQYIIPRDELIDYDGWENYAETAMIDYESYAAHLQSLMDSYSIKDEGELFSSCFVSLKNRVSDRDQDDMSLYNTATIIEQRLSTIFGTFRKQFYESETWGSFNDLTHIDPGRLGKEHKEVFKRVCTDPTIEMKQKAIAYYKIAYDQDPKKGKRFLSFAWLAWDVIVGIRHDKLQNQDGFKNYAFDPLSERLSAHIDEYIQANERSFKRFITKIINKSEAAGALTRYCIRYEGLSELLFFIYKWGAKYNLFSGPLKPEHLCLIVILFGLNKLDTMNFSSYCAWLEQTDNYIEDENKVNVSEQRGGLGRKFILFIEFLSSRQFEKMKKLEFLQAGLNYWSIFLDCEWVPLHQLALKTFNLIAFNNQFESLPFVEGLHDQYMTRKEAIRVEAEPFVIEVPLHHSNKISPDMVDKLRIKTGCEYIVLRRLDPRFYSESDRLIVSSYGTIEANQKLKDLLTVRPNINSGINCREKAQLLVKQVFEILCAN